MARLSVKNILNLKKIIKVITVVTILRSYVVNAVMKNKDS